MNAYYTYREITCKAELIQYFKYRFQAFNQGQVEAFLQVDSVEMEIDPYDLKAKHYGLFKVEGNTQNLVGGVRVINETESKNSDTLHEIARENLNETAFLNEILEYPYYMISISKFKDQLLQVYRGFRKKGKKVADTGRFFILPSERSLKLLNFFELAIITNGFFIEKNDIGITACYPKIARFHKLFGFKEFEKIGEEKFKGLKLLNLFITKANIPSAYQSDISKMEAAFKKYQKIYFHPQSPGYYNSKQTLKIPLNDGKLVDAA